MKLPTLSEEQTRAVRRLLAFDKPVQSLGGYAGTGKTTVIAHIKKQLREFHVAAFTGKAASVLRKKGVPASTIHGLIYHCIETTDSRGRPTLTWRLKMPDELDCRGIIIDESSMVSKELFDDLQSFELPLIFVGDHGQLEPVGGKDFNLMRSPDIVLETIHRNAGEIAYFAEYVRKGGIPRDWTEHPECTGEQVNLLTYDSMEKNPKRLLRFDQTIVAYNRTRVDMNKLVRWYRDFDSIAENAPVVKDRIIVLRNNAGLGVFNGMQGIVRKVNRREETLTFECDGKEYNLHYVRDVFNHEKPDLMRISPHRVPCDFGYAITCHKAQGDEFNWVCVLEQSGKLWDMKRWMYTAASRARKRLTWVHV